MSQPSGFEPVPCETGGAVTPLAASFNYETLCDVDPGTGIVYNVVTQQTEYDDQGNPVGMAYFDATTGAPYVPVGEVTSCSLTAGSQIQVLCEFTTGGDVVQFIRRYAELDNGAILVQDATLDGDQTYDVDPTSTVGLCPGEAGCDPLAVTGLCLPGGAPIAVVLRRDCDTGVTTLDGYLTLLSGVFTPGPPPLGTVACGASESVQVSGTFCSVDTVSGSVLALVLVEYTYGPDGTIVSTRLVNAVDGTTYVVPAGAAITTCPAGVDAPDSDGLALCDDNGIFLRDFRRDENGTLVSYSDYTLALAPYVPAGEVRICQPGCCPITVAEVCLSNGHAGVVIRDENGALTRLDTVTGLPFVPGDIVPCALTRGSEPVQLCYTGPGGTDDVRRFLRHFTYGPDGAITGHTDTDMDGGALGVAPGAAFACPAPRPQTYTEAFSVVPGTPWTSAVVAALELESLTLTVVAGTVTVDGSGTGPAVTVPAGASMSWTRAAGASVLVGPASITAAAASQALVNYTASRQLP